MMTHSHYSAQCEMYNLIISVMLALRQACPPSSSENTTQAQAPICSLTYAIQHAYRTLLHPSSSPQLRHPMLSVVDGTSGQPHPAKQLTKSTHRHKHKSNSKLIMCVGFTGSSWRRQQVLPRRTTFANPARTQCSKSASCK